MRKKKNHFYTVFDLSQTIRDKWVHFGWLTWDWWVEDHAKDTEENHLKDVTAFKVSYKMKIFFRIKPKQRTRLLSRNRMTSFKK